MPIPQTLHQPITFSPEECPRNAEPIVIGNESQCPGIPNANFEGAPVTDWTLSGGLTEAGNDPLNVTGAQAVTHTLAQTGLEFSPGEYTITWNIDNQDAGELIMTVAMSGSVRGPFWTATGDSVDGVGTSAYSETFTIPGGYDETYTLTLGLRQQTGTAPPVQLDAVLNYLNVCPDTETDLNFCFQLPMFETGDELLGLSEVNYVTQTTFAAVYNDVEDSTGATCGSPTTAEFNIIPNTVPITMTGSGNWFFEYEMGDVTIDYSLNPDDDTSGEVLLRAQDGVEITDAVLNESKANTSFLQLSTNSWNNGDGPDVDIRSKSECDDTDERRKWDITINSWSWTPNFYETTFTAEDDTFYRLKFDLAKTSSVRALVTDSASATIFEATETGPTFDKIFLTGTLPTTTVTVRFEIFTADEYPDANWNLAVLTNITLYKMCKWEVTLQDLNGSTIATLTETHATTAESLYTVSYHKNILYCLNIQNIDAACYVMQAENQCDTGETWLSNQFRICEDSCELNRVTWDHGGVKYIGSNCLDYTSYDYDTFFFAKIDLQDLTQEWEGTYYRDARYELQNPYSAFSDTQVMQVWPLPPFMRKALAVAMSSEFFVDGVEYRKADDDAIAPQFNAVSRSPVRILVQKTGDHVQSKNL